MQVFEKIAIKKKTIFIFKRTFGQEKQKLFTNLTINKDF